jgi:ribosomal protein S18 acetylase RimI-like enzyme
MPTFRPATHADIDALLPLMRDFYSFEKLPWDAPRTRRLLNNLISDPRLGRVILIHSAAAPPPTLIGYLVLTFGFSLEFHGRNALLDEFYIAPSHRSAGIGSQALDHAIALLRDEGIAALHLEADHFNDRGHAFYLRHGFRDHPRHLMTKWLGNTPL